MRSILDNECFLLGNEHLYTENTSPNYLKSSSDYFPVTQNLAPDFKHKWNMLGKRHAYNTQIMDALRQELLSQYKTGSEIIKLAYDVLDTLTVNEDLGKFQHLDRCYFYRGYSHIFTEYIRHLGKLSTIDGTITGNSYSCHYRHRVNNINKILYMLVLKKEYLQYYNQCLVLNKQPRPEIFKLLVTKDFDIVRSSLPRIRKNYRKYVKNHYLSLGVEIEEVDDIFDYLFTKFKITGSTPGELEKNKIQFFKDLITTL